MDVGDWLCSLGLSQYETLFRQNDIDAEVLSELTDATLKNLACPSGTASACSRRSQVWPQRKPMRNQRPQRPVRRRRLGRAPTAHRDVCDLVGSTAMSARLDPEEHARVIGSYHRCCATLIEPRRFVAKYMGDGVLAISAIPRPTNTTPSARAGRARHRRGRTEARHVAARSCTWRVGIATGLVVVGDLVGSGKRKSAASSARRRTRGAAASNRRTG